MTMLAIATAFLVSLTFNPSSAHADDSPRDIAAFNKAYDAARRPCMRASADYYPMCLPATIAFRDVR